MDEPEMILQRSALADAGFEDYDVLSEGKSVGRIFQGISRGAGAAVALVLLWSGGVPTISGYEPTREDAMAAFRKAWVRQ
jgi:hypothetical protein